MKKILIINAGWEQVDLIQTAKNMGLYVIATDINKDAPGFRFADETVVLDPRDISSLYELAKEKKVNGITADQCDYSYYAANIIAKRMGLMDSGLAAIQNSTNKKWMRQSCEMASIRQPCFFVCHDLESVCKAINHLGFPIIIKPVDNRGNFGVNKVENENEVEDAFYEAVYNSHSRECIVEQFIEGQMFTVDGFFFRKYGHQSLAVASKQMLGGKKRVAMEITYPAEVSQGKIPELKEFHTKVVHALGIQAGCTHGEYIIDQKGQIFLVECANRGGGCFTSSRIVPVLSGYNLSELLLLTALGEDMNPLKYQNNLKSEAVILSFFKFSAGTVKSIKYPNFEQYDDVLAFRLNIKENDVIDKITNDANRHGFFILKGNCVDELREKLKLYKKEIQVTYE